MPVSFSGLKDGDVINLEIADTAFSTEDINERDTIYNNQVTIKSAALAKLKNGPLDIGFYIDKNFPLDNTTKEGGNVNLFYRLKFKKTTLKK